MKSSMLTAFKSYFPLGLDSVLPLPSAAEVPEDTPLQPPSLVKGPDS